MVQAGEPAQNVEAYLAKLVELLRMDGVRFPDNKQRRFSRLEPIYAGGRSNGIHAEGRWVNEGETDEGASGAATVGVVFGPQFGPITAKWWRRSSGRRHARTRTSCSPVSVSTGRHRRRSTKGILELLWEASAAFRLESSDVVQFYVRNDHLGLTIPYEYMGIDHFLRARFPGTPLEEHYGGVGNQGL